MSQKVMHLFNEKIIFFKKVRWKEEKEMEERRGELFR